MRSNSILDDLNTIYGGDMGQYLGVKSPYFRDPKEETLYFKELDRSGNPIFMSPEEVRQKTAYDDLMEVISEVE